MRVAGTHVRVEPTRLFSDRTDNYVRFVRFVRYPEAIRAYFLRSPLLRSGLRVLDAGCGTGVVTLAFREALQQRRLEPGLSQGFDLTPAMLDRFRVTLRKRSIQDVELAQANVLELSQLPSSWRSYDLIISASMLEYLPRTRLSSGLNGLRSLLAPGGNLVVFITRRNAMTRPLIGHWWQSNLYKKGELEHAFLEAGFASFEFGHFPLLYRHFGLWGHIVVAQR
jgi:ubiquinone/menaquinone biosynthesis C-methylase UbiE